MFVNEKFKEIYNQYLNHDNSHALLIYTNDLDKCREDTNNLIKKIFDDDNFNHYCSDFVSITSKDKNIILKDDVSRLRYLFQTTSSSKNYRIYLIEEAHKLNSSSANLILKFLEEPPQGVIGILITTNLDAVLSTIRSRCQIINIFYDISNVVDDNQIQLINNFFNQNKYEMLFNAKKTFETYDRKSLINLFELYIHNCYRHTDKTFKPEIIRKLNRAITLLNNNVNIDYVFDYLLLESGKIDGSCWSNF